MCKQLKKNFVISPIILAATLLNCAQPTDNRSQSGVGPADSRLEHRQQSPNFDGKRFKNPIETDNDPEIGKAFGPFDLTLIKIGAYDRMWPDVHLDPHAR